MVGSGAVHVNMVGFEMTAYLIERRTTIDVQEKIHQAFGPALDCAGGDCLALLHTERCIRLREPWIHGVGGRVPRIGCSLCLGI